MVGGYGGSMRRRWREMLLMLMDWPGSWWCDEYDDGDGASDAAAAGGGGGGGT